MTNHIHTPQQIADILLQKPGRLTQDTPRVPRVLLNGRLNLASVFGDAAFAHRPATAYEELLAAGFSVESCKTFERAQQRAHTEAATMANHPSQLQRDVHPADEPYQARYERLLQQYLVDYLQRLHTTNQLVFRTTGNEHESSAVVPTAMPV
jgi:hypothetical protein